MRFENQHNKTIHQTKIGHEREIIAGTLKTYKNFMVCLIILLFFLYPNFVTFIRNYFCLMKGRAIMFSTKQLLRICVSDYIYLLCFHMSLNEISQDTPFYLKF